MGLRQITLMAIPTIMTITTESGRGEGAISLDPQTLLALSALASPSYPVGAFSHSHGLEWAIGAGEVTSAALLGARIGDCIAHGAGRSDAILLAEAWRRASSEDADGLRELNALALALAPSAGRLLEMAGPGSAFRRTTQAAWSASPMLEALPSDAAYPVAFGAAAAALAAPIEAAALLFLQGFASNLVSAGIRLVPIGQTDGQRILARLAPELVRVGAEALGAGLDEIGSVAMRADLSAMKQETMDVRLFRS